MTINAAAWRVHERNLDQFINNPEMEARIPHMIQELIKADAVEPVEFLIGRAPKLLSLRLDGGMSLLNAAAAAGAVQCLELLVRQGCDTTSDEVSLGLAVQNNHIQAVAYLLDVCPSPCGRHLVTACYEGYTATVDLLCSHEGDIVCDVNEIDLGTTPLLAAVSSNQLGCAKVLLRHGADPCLAVRRHPVDVAVDVGSLDMVDLLGSAGCARVQYVVRDAGACRPVCLAAFNGRSDLVDCLCEHGFDPKLKDHLGNSPLFLASQNGFIECVRVLLRHGGLPNEPGMRYLGTPLFKASQNGHAPVCEVLCENGADVDQAANDGCTPLYKAAQNGHEDCARVLLGHGARMDLAQVKNDVRPLFVACENGHLKVVVLLIANGDDVDYAMSDGVTPLCIASARGHEDVCRALLLAGADPCKGPSEALRPLGAAVNNHHVKLAEMLVEQGARM